MPRAPEDDPCAGDITSDITRYHPDFRHGSGIRPDNRVIVPRAADRPQPPNPVARDRAIEEHLPLVWSLARRHASQDEPYEDLVQAGTVGLIKAVDRFDPDRGVAFSTYAVPVIEGEIRHHLRDAGRLVRLPRPLTELNARIGQAERELTARLGRAPTVDELARAAGVPVPAVNDALAARAATRPEMLSAEIEDDRADLATAEARMLLRRGWRDLPERDRRILELRFFGDLTQGQIAKEVGLSQAHVSRLIADALARLRSTLGEGVAGPEGAAYGGHHMASEDTTGKGSGHSGRVLVRMPQSLHAELVQTAEREGVSLNALITGALASAIGWRNGAAHNGDAVPTAPPAGTLSPPEPASPPTADAPAEAGEPSTAAALRRRWSSVALIVNVVVIALAAVVAIALLVVALAQG
jgi:RNA polymerase sigma-B factor